VRSPLTLAVVTLLAACAPSREASFAPVPDPGRVAVTPAAAPCAAACEPQAVPAEVAQALERRIDELRTRGGDCARYGEVLERSYRDGRIRIRPYMWRVDGRLASGEASPSGEMTLAREVDPLNLGVRTLADVIASMEHEAAHIAFDIRRGNGGEERVAGTVRGCGGAV
jgi:hypothetical protein